MAKWLFWILVASTVVLRADPPPSGEDMIRKIAARDKELVQRRRAFDYDIAISREKLNEDNSVSSTETETVTMRGNVSPSYHTRDGDKDKPEEEAKQQSREEPFELLKIIDHYTYTVEGSETVDGVDCWRIHFVPRPDMPYDNREEKVLNNTSGLHLGVQGRLLAHPQPGLADAPGRRRVGFRDAGENELPLRCDADAQRRLRSRQTRLQLLRRHHFLRHARARHAQDVQLPRATRSDRP